MAILREAHSAGRAWIGAEIRDTTDWITHMMAEELEDLDRALRSVLARGHTWGRFGPDDFPLTSCNDRIAGIAEELKEGRGFVLLRGLPVDRYSIDELKTIYWGLGVHLGTIVSQNAKGSLIEHVTDLKPSNFGDPNLRSYVTNESQPPHTDHADVVGLLCVDRAKQGGESVIVSTLAIYNRILAEHPEYLEPLYAGYFHDLRGEGASGDLQETSDVPVPVFSFYKEQFRSWFHSKKMRNGALKRGVPLTPLQVEAMEYVEALGRDSEMRLDMQLERGDIQLLNNFSAMHYRNAFSDGDGRKRLMLRIWIQLPDMGEFDPALARWAREGVPMQSWSKDRPLQAIGGL